MCTPRKKKRQQLVVALEQPAVEEKPAQPEPEPEPVVDPIVVVLPCPQTQPRIHVKCSTCNKDVSGVQVMLNGVDLGRTGRDGKTAAKTGGMIPGKGPVKLVQGERPAHVLTKDVEVDYPKLCNDTFLAEAKCVSHLVVDVLRHDGQPVKGGRVTFEIDGPDGKKNETTVAFKGRADDPPRDIEAERKEFPAITPGACTITLAKIAELLAAQKPDSTSAEVWKLGPNDKGVTKLTLKPGTTHHVRFVLTRYTKVQFIGFAIEPSTIVGGTLPSGEIYMGDADADKDIGDRSIVLKNAIKDALASPKLKKEPEVLKVFMAAEFYWRGKEGAYPVEKLSKILDEMRAETGKAEYADWLFVHGTAIGYLKHGNHKLVRRQYEVTGATGASATVKIVEASTSKDRLGVFAEIPDNWDKNDLTKVPKYHWALRQGGKRAYVVKATAGTGSYTLQLHRAVDFTDGAIELVEPLATEVFNVALVQKGGPGSGAAGLREAIIYKEDISAIDFLSIMFGKHDEFHERSGDNRKIEIHGRERKALPTSGARDVLGASPNTSSQGGVSERTDQGLGGGSIFELDGITFGLEICRDHLQGKLRRYYQGDPDATPALAPAASAGEPKVQVQLVPSWGAWIDPPNIVGVDGVLVFNVDGPDGAKAGAVTGKPGYECPHHPGIVGTKRAKCTAGQHYACGYISAATVCPHCTTPMTDSIADYFCKNPTHYLKASPCAICNKPTTFLGHYCAACDTLSPTAGPCTEVGCPTKPARTPIYRCDEPLHRHNPPCPTFGAPGYYCDTYHEVTKVAGPCSCGGPQIAIDWYTRAKDVTVQSSAPPRAVADAPGTYTTTTATDVDDDTSPTGKKTEYKTKTVASTPKQTDYFKTDGKVVVYDPLDLPKPDVV